MVDESHYYVIKKRVRSGLKIKRSEFVCSLEPVETLAQAKDFISRISKENRNATHNCWAYVVGDDGGVFHSSDAGEPSGTAGKPILKALQQNRLTNVAAVVTRYYGGVKLGVRGLIDAYFSSVDQAIARSELALRVQTVSVTIQAAYAYNDALVSQLKRYGVTIRETDYADMVCHTAVIEKKDWNRVNALLEQHQARKWIKYALL